MGVCVCVCCGTDNNVTQCQTQQQQQQQIPWDVYLSARSLSFPPLLTRSFFLFFSFLSFLFAWLSLLMEWADVGSVQFGPAQSVLLDVLVLPLHALNIYGLKRVYERDKSNDESHSL